MHSRVKTHHPLDGKGYGLPILRPGRGLSWACLGP
jgi:hypothetical protein